MALPREARAVAFDLDGTLIDSEALVKEAYLAVAGGFGVSMSDEHFLSLVGLHRIANDAQLRTLYGQDFPVDDFRAVASKRIGDRVAPLKQGAAELLDTLEALKIPVALVTSSSRPWVERHFLAHRLTDRFRVVVARGDYINGKPDPEPYTKAVTALGIAPASVVALEDSHAGVTAAHAAGLMTVMVPDLLQADEEIRTKTVLIARGLSELIPLLKTYNG